MVPVPKSSLASSGGLRVPYNMAVALVEQGLGGSVAPCLKRARAVPKAALSRQGDRPRAAAHPDSITVESVEAPDRAILVDDVVTTGATLMGAAGRLRAAFPGIEIAAFAAMRTVSFDRLEKIRDPKAETIILYPSGKTFRK